MGFGLLAQRLSNRPVTGGPIVAVRAPLRVCPLGAHVDHQGGEVTGAALDRGVHLLCRPRPEPVVTLESVGFSETVEIDLHRGDGPSGDWGDYLRAIVQEIGKIGVISHGFDGVMQGDLVGMGVSSSAAVMVAYCLALAEINRIDLSRAETARLVQRAENRHIGVASGLLDQSVILFAEAEKLTHIACREFTVEHIKPPGSLADFRIVVAFSGMARTLSGTGYNDRVGECGQAAAALMRFGGIGAGEHPILSEVPRGLFESQARKLPENLRRRATHYFGEVGRVHAGIEAWRQGDLEQFGSLMTASGESSIVNYQCGTPPLIALYETLRAAPGVFGARFSGAGFGGSCVALVAAGAVDEVIERVSRDYLATFPELGPKARYAECRTAGRAEVVDPGEFS